MESVQGWVDDYEAGTKVEGDQTQSRIKIWITQDTRQFRAKITSRLGLSGEVTVGGENWKRGDFKGLQPEIIRRCRALAAALVEKAAALE